MVDAERLPDWWGDVFKTAEVLAPGDDMGIGHKVLCRTQGRLPIAIEWTAEMIEARCPHSWRLRFTGDLDGDGLWSLTQDGGVADIRHDLRVAFCQPLLRVLGPAVWSFVEVAYAGAMAKGLEGLKHEVLRRRPSLQGVGQPMGS